MYIKKSSTGQIYFIDEKGINFINSENYKELIFNGGDLFYDTLVTNDVKISTTSLQINGKTFNIPEERLFVYNNLFNVLNGNSNYYSIDLNIANSFLGIVYVKLNNTNYEIKLAFTNIGKDVNDGINLTVLNKLLNRDWLISPDFSDDSILIGFILIKYTGVTFNIANPANFNFKTFPIFPLIKNKLLEDIVELTFTEDNFNYIINNILNTEYNLDNIVNYNLFLNEYFLFEGNKFFIENGTNLEIYKSNVTSNLLVSEFTNSIYYKKISSSSIPPHTHYLIDITDLNNLTLDWSQISNKPTIFPSDWLQISNKPTIFSSDWSQISNIPSSFPPSTHTHLLNDITDLNTLTLDWTNVLNKPLTFPSDWSIITNIPSSFPPSPHNHQLNDITDLNALILDWSQISNKPSTFPPSPHNHTLSDIINLNTLTLDWNNITNKPSTFPSDWTTTINKPSTFPSDWSQISNIPSSFPPSTHTHLLNDIIDFPSGTLGDVFIHNGTKWQAENIIEYYPLSWFKSNQTLIPPKNKILVLQGTTFHKITDGVSQLGQLQWRNNGINLNGQHISIGGELYYRYDTSTNNYLASNVKKQSIITGVQTINIDTNALRGQYIILKQPSTINYVGINIVSVSNPFSSQFIFLIYSINFETQTATRLAYSSPITVTTTGYYKNTTPFNLDLAPGVYMIAYANVISSGTGTIQAVYTENTEFQLHRLLTEPYPQYLQTNIATLVTPITLTSPPTTTGLGGVSNSQISALMYYWFNPIN